jgi:putative membrane protein
MIANRIGRSIALIAACSLIAGGPASMACGDDPACPCQTMAQTLAALTAIEGRVATGQTSFVDLQLLSDQEFLREALQDGAIRVELGQLAQQKSQSQDVREFSAAMVKDDNDLSDQVIVRVAKMLEMSGKKELSKKDKQMAANLEALSGAQFDQEFIRIMLKNHQQVLKKFSGEMNLTQNPGVKVASELGTSEFTVRLKLLEQMQERHTAIAANQNPLLGKN